MSLVEGPHTAEALAERDFARRNRRLLKRDFARRMAGIRRKAKALEALRAAELERRFGIRS